ncbi:MAG: glycosyltransferase family 2 protein [Rubrivivax sp.]
MTIGVVVVNYNAGALLTACVQSVRAERPAAIVVVDNGSTDGSDLALLQAFPDTQLLRLENPGFGAANNHGAKHIQTDVVFCINPDTVVHPGAFAQLSRALQSDPEVAVVGPRLLNSDGSVYPSARAFPSFIAGAGHGIVGLVWPDNRWSRAYKRLDQGPAQAGRVDWVSGAAMFIRRSAFDEVAGFDEGYFLYMEEVDLCWRLRERGWKVRFEPQAVLTHVQGVSTARRPYRMLWSHHASAIRYNLKTTRGMSRLMLPIVVGGLLLRVPLAWLAQWRKGLS